MSNCCPLWLWICIALSIWLSIFNLRNQKVFVWLDLVNCICYKRQMLASKVIRLLWIFEQLFVLAIVFHAHNSPFQYIDGKKIALLSMRFLKPLYPYLFCHEFLLSQLIKILKDIILYPSNWKEYFLIWKIIKDVHIIKCRLLII